MNNRKRRMRWRYLLASMVATLSVTAVCEAQQRGRFLQAMMDRYDTDGDGRLSAEERAAIPNRGARKAQDSRGNKTTDETVPEKMRGVYGALLGPHAVDSVDTLTLAADHRDDDLKVRVTYPKSVGRFPVIVFSHGAYGSKDGYRPLSRHWASHGYVVVQGTHGDSLSLVSPTDRIRVAKAANPFREMPVESHWKTRAQDVRLLIDSLDKLPSHSAALRGKIDTTKIAIAGHSYGSHTAQLVAGLNFGEDLKSDSPIAMLLLSPPGPNPRLGLDAYNKISIPLMTVTGSKDNVVGRGQEYTDRLKTHERIPSKEKYLLFMQDAEHNLGGVSGSVGRLSGGGFNPVHLTSVKSATTAFWDHCLKAKGKAGAFLKADSLKSATSNVSQIKQSSD